jgi:D-amino-acid dehydrogenase
VVVVGGGVIGLFTARSLALRGAEVTILEAREPGTGASAANAGWVAPSHSGPLPAPGLMRTALRWILRPDSPLWIHPRVDPRFALWLFAFWRQMNRHSYQAGLRATMDLAWGTVESFEQLRDELGLEVHADGVLLAYTSRPAFEAGLRDANALAAFGHSVSASATDADVQDLEPALSMEVRGAFVVADDRHLDPLALNAALLADLARRGVTIRPQTPAVGFSTSEGRVDGVETAGGRVPADVVVIAAGADTPSVTATLGLRLPVESGKGYAIDVAPSPVQLRRPTYLSERRVAVTPLPDRLRLSGTMELGGRDDRISRVRVRGIEQSARRLLRGWAESEAMTTTYRAGRRPVTPDGLPVIGPLPRHDNVWVVSGHAMLGVTLGPRTGELVADGIVNGDVDPVLRPFAPTRFAR